MKKSTRKHGTTLALDTGDAFVLITEKWDQYNHQRDKVSPVETFHMERISNRHQLTYHIKTGGDQTLTSNGQPIQLNEFLSIRPVHPITTVEKGSKVKTLFVLEVTHGYRVHYLDYLQHKLPEVFNQLTPN